MTDIPHPPARPDWYTIDVDENGKRSVRIAGDKIIERLELQGIALAEIRAARAELAANALNHELELAGAQIATLAAAQAGLAVDEDQALKEDPNGPDPD